MPENKNNPLLVPSDLPFGAFPFNRLQKSHFLPAIADSIAAAQAQLNAMKTSAAEPTFENTVLVLESAPETVNRTATIFFNLLGAESDEEIQEMAKEISPKLASFASDISLDSEIFARVKTIWEKRKTTDLNEEQIRLVEKVYKDFVRNGALLTAESKAKVREIDQELASLSVEFSDHVLKYVNEFKMVLENKEDLAGLPENSIEAAAQAAKEAGLEGKWVFTLHGPSYLPFMTYADRADLREKIWRAYNARALGGQYDNRELSKRIALLRHQRAGILGFATHADFVLEERMAETAARVTQFLDRLLEKSRSAAERDVQEVAALKGSTLMPWDYGYWSEKLKMRDFDFDEEVLRPYFKLENVVAGAFEHARLLYGLKFKPATDIPAYHPDVTVYEVVDEESNRHIGLFYADFFPRKGKRSGAWMTSFREQGLQGGKVERPHVSIVCNFTKPTQTKPSLLSFNEVRTLFHEFGHALHGLLSDVTYVSLGGTNVYWDFVELPSQIMENWTLEKEALDLFTRHYQTGEKIPTELTEKIKRAARFQAGFASLRQLNFGLLDMAWHAKDPSGITDVEEFEQRATARTRILPLVPGSNLTTSFTHIFSGGYSAGYYSYKWAEVLDADAFEFFKEKGLFNREVARSFRENVLSKGGTRHPMELYKKFRGREPDPDALLRRDGLL
ncbi:MAG: M3 family metallopeptidase [Bdellovibrionaceae bacterium]|nr:M3 family metallopeptidase [Pseudobdellovibrionaceae bacterium]